MAQAQKPATRQRGLALVVVLWAAVLLALIAGGVTRLARSDLNLARNLAESAQAELAADSALWTAVYRIANGGPDAWGAEGTIYAWRFGDSHVRVRVTDELGRIDINVVPPDLLTALFVAAGAEPEGAAVMAEAVAAFRASGSENPTSPGASFPVEGPTAPFATTDGLLRVPGMTRALQDRISNSITVYTGLPAPRPGRAPALVQAALEGQVHGDATGTEEPATVVAMENPDGAMPLPVESEGALRQTASVLLHVEAEAARAGGARFAREAVIELRRRGPQPYRIRLWSRGRGVLFPEADAAQ